MDAPALQELKAQLASAEGASIVPLSADVVAGMMQALADQTQVTNELVARVAEQEEAKRDGGGPGGAQDAGGLNAQSEKRVLRWCKKLLTAACKQQGATADTVNTGLEHGMYSPSVSQRPRFNPPVFSVVMVTPEFKAGLTVMLKLVEDSLPVTGCAFMEEGTTVEEVLRVMRAHWSKRAQSRRKNTRFKQKASDQKKVFILPA